MINIFIIYIEADWRANLKQEKSLFQNSASRRFWHYFFKRVGYANFQFKLLPHSFKNKEERAQWLKILDQSINDFTNFKSRVSTRILVTGDHNEKDQKVLARREALTNEIKAKYVNYGVQIILERHPKFKIEWIIEEIIGQKVTKSFLQQKIKTKHPTIENLINFLKLEDVGKAYDIITRRLEASSHPLFKEIVKIKP